MTVPFTYVVRVVAPGRRSTGREHKGRSLRWGAAVTRNARNSKDPVPSGLRS